MTSDENLFKILSKETKAAYSIEHPNDMDKTTRESLLLTEVLFQLKELNTTTNAMHDELWDLAQRSDS